MAALATLITVVLVLILIGGPSYIFLRPVVRRWIREDQVEAENAEHRAQAEAELKAASLLDDESEYVHPPKPGSPGSGC